MWFSCSTKEANLFLDYMWSEEDDLEALMLSSKVNHEHWHQIVNTERDIFCITADDWDSLTQDCQKSGYWDWDLKMAVEFDPSWNEPLEYQRYGSPVGNLSGSLNFVIQWLYEIVTGELDLKTRIIDRHARWMAQYSSIGSTFHDYDEEFIEIPLEYGRRRSARLVAGSALLDFFYYLEDYYYSNLHEIYCRRQGLSLDYESDMEERDRFGIGYYFSILVLRSNQVEYAQD
ncbi:hypothetical protein LB507_006407 [Fusarium sp. FIESC RH6]|nr:hypothetical protein LB507_006407 [Fusarium sp. FIESC RH6]